MPKIRTRASRRALGRRLFVVAVCAFVACNLYVLTRRTAGPGAFEGGVSGEGAHRWGERESRRLRRALLLAPGVPQAARRAAGEPLSIAGPAQRCRRSRPPPPAAAARPHLAGSLARCAPALPAAPAGTAPPSWTAWGMRG